MERLLYPVVYKLLLITGLALVQKEYNIKLKNNNLKKPLNLHTPMGKQH